MQIKLEKSIPVTAAISPKNRKQGMLLGFGTETKKGVNKSIGLVSFEDGTLKSVISDNLVYDIPAGNILTKFQLGAKLHDILEDSNYYYAQDDVYRLIINGVDVLAGKAATDLNFEAELETYSYNTPEGHHLIIDGVDVLANQGIKFKSSEYHEPNIFSAKDINDREHLYVDGVDWFKDLKVLKLNFEGDLKKYDYKTSDDYWHSIRDEVDIFKDVKAVKIGVDNYYPHQDNSKFFDDPDCFSYKDKDTHWHLHIDGVDVLEGLKAKSYFLAHKKRLGVQYETDDKIRHIMIDGVEIDSGQYVMGFKVFSNGDYYYRANHKVFLMRGDVNLLKGKKDDDYHDIRENKEKTGYERMSWGGLTSGGGNITWYPLDLPKLEIKCKKCEARKDVEDLVRDKPKEPENQPLKEKKCWWCGHKS